MAVTDCHNCGKKISDKVPACPFCGDSKLKQQKPHVPSAITTKTKTLINPMLVISVVVAMAISFGVFVFYQHVQTQKANSHFSTMVGSLSTKLIGLAVNSEKLADETERIWRDAIFGKRRDFNSALFDLRMLRQKEIIEIQTSTMEIASRIKIMTPPTGKEREFQRLKELYLLIDKYAEMATAPTGSLQTYSQQSNELNMEVKSAIRELELMK